MWFPGNDGFIVNALEAKRQAEKTFDLARVLGRHVAGYHWHGDGSSADEGHVLWMSLRWLVLAGTILSFVYYFAVICCARLFFSTRDEDLRSITPPVSILKPVRGPGRGAYENFASFCRQTYPRYEILFGAAHDQDPTVPAIRAMIRDFPELPIRLLVGSEEAGAKDKVNKLCRLVARGGFVHFSGFSNRDFAT